MSAPAGKLRVLIVDDEELERRGLALRLAKHADVEVVDQCRNALDAIKSIHEHAPDVVFLDIQMPGRSGFDVLAALDMAEPPQVVFVTAHDEHAVRAFQVQALDYLLKPLDDERLEEAMRRVREARAQHDRSDLAKRMRALLLSLDERLQGAAPRPEDGQLAVRTHGRIRLLRIADIDYVEAEGDYVNIFHGKHSSLMQGTLSDMERRLQEHGFLRIHRSVIVNKARIAELRALDNGEYEVCLSGGTRLKLSRSYRAALQEILAGKVR